MENITNEVSTFIEMYNIARDRGLKAVKAVLPKSVAVPAMRNGLGLAWGGDRNQEFLDQQTSVDFSLKGIQFRIVSY
jgi:hypothetical protein